MLADGCQPAEALIEIITTIEEIREMIWVAAEMRVGDAYAALAIEGIEKAAL